MSKKCDGCKNEDLMNGYEMLTIPYVAHQSAAARQERQIRRMWIALIVAIALMFFTNMIWVGVFSSYDYSSEEIIVDAEDDGDANYIGQDGNIYNGEDNSEETQTD